MKKSLLNIPIDIDTSERKFYLIAFSVFFSFVFLNVFTPFGLYHDGSVRGEEVFIELAIAMFSAFFALLFTQFILRPMVKASQASWSFFILWFLCEASIVASTWTLLDALDGKDIRVVAKWLENFAAFALTFSLPYFLYLLIVSLRDTSSENTSLKLDQETDTTLPIGLKDEAGVVRLSIPTHHILMIQSADNYLEICYLENDAPQTFLLRNSLKDMELQLADTPIVRCHRSAMVNKDAIETYKKSGSGMLLILRGLPDRPVSVSKTYLSEFRKIFN